MKEKRYKDFANGRVYALETDDGYPIETTDTFLPYYTKDAIGRNQNFLNDENLGSRNDRWMIGVSTMSGCPVGCKFCATGQLKRYRNLDAMEIVQQVIYIVNQNYPKYDPEKSKEFKINYTRMGEPFLNIEAVKEAIKRIQFLFPNSHHYVSTIGIKGSDFSWITDNITLQFSIHSLFSEKRDWLIPFKNKMSLKEMGEIRTNSKLKTTINMTLIDESDFDIKLLKQYFDPKYFFIKLSPINPNTISDENEINEGVFKYENLI